MKIDKPAVCASVVAEELFTLGFSQQVAASTDSEQSSPAQTVSAKAALGDIPSPQYIVPEAGLVGFFPDAHLVLAHVAAQQWDLPAEEQEENPSQGNVFWSIFGALSLPQKKVGVASVPSPAL
jgi:hypothetical protein